MQNEKKFAKVIIDTGDGQNIDCESDCIIGTVSINNSKGAHGVFFTSCPPSVLYATVRGLVQTLNKGVESDPISAMVIKAALKDEGFALIGSAN